ncbi:TetR/AcrR family transcriptional regulator C-terminal domain-containing protein [Nocardia puris]|uniref:TetR family transcriptional regulator n=1 Tax=Nocardia puris TaxID=208602 RepID=A0A366DV42_9NOCA|nr:TetR/AcrR family transcriptional regulator C-terminal domain-containing protein [Nocardia puris]MBF6210510.1 TetR/AcrR family transcriptional regulator C-terminal domain-containing protein [Nocardia puris]MBF6369235.1 TetR/AcrR family transcriptional regulator C-terminal domain-containing protein [Nocardia puris]MBF6457770.1 TetR/AcrR family transcriptional regulator C-terminal domain-containing protein [Nocardia puris]RBO93937.1 TetR family transcriptional regulator [Nocardia puris]
MGTDQRPRLSRGQILRAAVARADRDGVGAVTMRNVAADLGVEAMSLYHHVANKAELLDGMVEVIVETINEAVEPLSADSPAEWKPVLRRRILTARAVLLRHTWAPALISTRSPMTLSLITYFDALLGLLRTGGFSYDLAHHAMHALGSRALGFTQELFESSGAPDDEAATAELAAMADRFPNIAGMIAAGAHEHGDAGSTLGWCDDQSEFEFGLDIILDGLERLRAGDRDSRPVTS